MTTGELLRADLSDANVVDWYDRFSGIPWHTYRRVERDHWHETLLRQWVIQWQVRNTLLARSLAEPESRMALTHAIARYRHSLDVLRDLWKEGRAA